MNTWRKTLLNNELVEYRLIRSVVGSSFSFVQTTYCKILAWPVVQFLVLLGVQISSELMTSPNLRIGIWEFYEKHGGLEQRL